MARILFVHSRRSSFIAVDRALLAERHELRDFYQPGRWANPLAVLRAVRDCDAVVGWWASWHTFWPITLAWLLRKPSLMIVGGFDVASIPEIGYGYQQGGARKWLSRWIMRRAGLLATNSYYSREELERNAGIAPERVAVMHHGVPDPFGSLPRKPDGVVALSVGIVDRINLERKGQRAFVAAAAHAPEVSFVLAGRLDEDAAAELRPLMSDNVTLIGWVQDDELLDRYREATVYVQASRHEGFGVSVAEAMLGGCVPVVTAVGALPEVVGDVGIQVTDADPAALAAAVREAALLDPAAGARARERVLTEFSVERRRQALRALVDELLD